MVEPRLWVIFAAGINDLVVTVVVNVFDNAIPQKTEVPLVFRAKSEVPNAPLANKPEIAVLPDTVRFLETEAVPVIVVMSEMPSPREVLPDEVNELVTVNLFVEVLPDTVRFVPIVVRPVIVVRSPVPSPKFVVPLDVNAVFAVSVFAYKDELLIAN